MNNMKTPADMSEQEVDAELETISNEQQRRMRKVVEELVKRDPVALEKWLRDAEKGIAAMGERVEATY